MATHLEFVRSTVDANAIRGAAQGTRVAAVLTDGELVVGRAGMFGRQWGSKLHRYDLNRLTDVLLVPYPAANMLLLKFAGTPPESVTVMYDSGQRAGFEPIVAALQSHATANGGTATS